MARTEKELENGYRMTQQEAETAFGNGGLYLEKFIENFRHIEIQIIGINMEMSFISRKRLYDSKTHAKLVEESPSPILSDEQREEMGNQL